MRTSRSAVIGASALVAAALATTGVAVAQGGDGSDPPRRGDAVTFHLLGVPDTTADVVITVDGRPIDEEGDFVPGDRFLSRDVLYELRPDDPSATGGGDHPQGDPVGQALIDCTIRAVDAATQDATLTCSAHLELPEGTLHHDAVIRFSEFVDPGHISAAVTGGDGLYAGAGGETTVREIPGDDPEGPTNSIWEVRL